MGAVDWIDPLAIGVVLAAKAAVEAGGGDLRIARMTPFVRAILTRYGADEIFECYDSVEDACDSFGGLDDGARC
jgi:anti-anti-sigma regulatory factor